MMGYQWLLFGFDGRINRARVWLAALIMLGLMALLGFAMFAIGKSLGMPINSFSFSTDDIFAIVDPASYRSMSSANLFQLIVRVVATPFFLWIYAAISIKRLHDRDRSGWWTVPFFVVPGLYNQLGGWLGDSIPAITLAIVVFIVALWGAVELYVLKGTHGDNRFGADMLAPADPVHTRPAWDQQSELEFVPHRAGPSAGPHVNRGI
ncbi:DUF805 domain-containing protein [Tardiphaga sp. 839_C3_N1_4]|jgi:uncharacterized membrane protein YhaH (DUF805 family)|uniref:DUF805 domain-containing protein n=1 Tax=Tardiphaga sp. 839_C3_N1_4 TaxID=3240761 RepID=UPI003F21DD74